MDPITQFGRGEKNDDETRYIDSCAPFAIQPELATAVHCLRCNRRKKEEKDLK